MRTLANLYTIFLPNQRLETRIYTVYYVESNAAHAQWLFLSHLQSLKAFHSNRWKQKQNA